MVGKSIEEPRSNGPPFAEFRRSRPTRVGTIRQTASSGRRHTDKPAGSRLLDGLQAIGVARCSRDGRHWRHQRVVPVALQGSAQDGVLPFYGFQRGLLKQVLPLRRTVWGWRGVRVGETSNLGLVQTRSTRRLAEPLQAITQVDASSDEEVLVSSNRGKRVVPRTDSELPATVPASPGVLSAGLLPEHEFPTTSRKFVGTCAHESAIHRQSGAARVAGSFRLGSEEILRSEKIGI